MWPPTEPQRDWRSEASVRRIDDYARLAARPSAPGYCTQIIRFWSCRYPARLLTIPA